MNRIYRSENEEVTKYIHDDGSETAIKFTDSCNHDLENLEEKYTNRKKYTIFISVSVGCFLSCKFCHLTLKNAKYVPLSNKQIINNIKEAVKHQLKVSPQLKDYYVKLSWMGMGDALNRYYDVADISLELLDWILDNDYAAGLDGVDLSTVFPKNVKPEWITAFNFLNTKLGEYDINPNNKIKDNMDVLSQTSDHYQNRSLFRLFYSISTVRNVELDNNMISDALTPYKVLSLLSVNDIEFNIIFHHLLIDNQNDSEEDILHLMEFLRRTKDKYELRILRYNECTSSPYKESRNILPIIKRLLTVSDNIKVQISPGSEVKAACGQFIVTVFKNQKEDKDTF